MDGRRRVAIAVGGALGASVRWAVLTSVVATAPLPWPVLAVNVVGSITLGVVLAEEWDHPRARVWLHDLMGIGFCGGLTTFSTFAVDVVRLMRDEAIGAALVYGALSLALSIAGVFAGAAAFRRVRALMLPLEEQP